MAGRKGPGEQPGKPELGWWESFGTPPSSGGHSGSFPGIGAGMPGAPGLGLGAAGESVQAVSCAPGGTGCSRAGPGTPGSRGAQDFPSRPSSSSSSVPWLDRPWAAQGTWSGGWGRKLREGRMAQRGLECRGARVAKLRGELQRGKSYRPLWAWKCVLRSGRLRLASAREFLSWWWRWWGDGLV